MRKYLCPVSCKMVPTERKVFHGSGTKLSEELERGFRIKEYCNFGKYVLCKPKRFLIILEDADHSLYNLDFTHFVVNYFGKALKSKDFFRFCERLFIKMERETIVTFFYDTEADEIVVDI